VDHGQVEVAEEQEQRDVGQPVVDEDCVGEATLWVVNSGTNAVTGFSVHAGTLTLMSTTPGPAGATPTGIVVT
jgi:hypothetical protein